MAPGREGGSPWRKTWPQPFERTEPWHHTRGKSQPEIESFEWSAWKQSALPLEWQRDPFTCALLSLVPGTQTLLGGLILTNPGVDVNRDITTRLDTRHYGFHLRIALHNRSLLPRVQNSVKP